MGAATGKLQFQNVIQTRKMRRKARCIKLTTRLSSLLRVVDSKTMNRARLMDFFIVDGDCLRRLVRTFELFKYEVYEL